MTKNHYDKQAYNPQFEWWVVLEMVVKWKGVKTV